MDEELETTGFGNEQPVVPEPAQEESLGNQFLSKIPEQDRPIVQKYVKDWDAGVTKRFQDLNGKLKPYQTLGELQEVQRYVNFGKSFRTNPQARDELFRQMWGAYQQQFGDDFETKILELLQIQQEQEMQEQEELGQEPPDEFTTFQTNVTSELEELRAFKDEILGEREASQEMEQLDTVLKTMHTQYGDFNEKFILSQFAMGATIPQAIKAWNDLKAEVGTQGNPKRQPPLTTGGGQGGVPNEQVDVSKLKGQDRRNAVMQWLEAASQ